MEKKLKVLIADNSSQFAKACQNELGKHKAMMFL